MSTNGHAIGRAWPFRYLPNALVVAPSALDHLKAPATIWRGHDRGQSNQNPRSAAAGSR